MANGTERAQRQTGEAFQRCKNDHEQFLEAYEKPTQIYRFLKPRQSVKPLFLHRNLSYMPRHYKPKRRRLRKKFRVDDLLNHVREIKPDLASEIKSDNHLKISFCGVEQGFSYQGLLADPASRLPADEEKEQGSSDEQGESSNKPEHGQLMEVELLLFKFKQSSVHLSNGSYPYTCLSLGKQFLRYRAASDEDNNDDDSDTPSQQQSRSRGEDHDLTLTIPESVLTWKGDQSPGTQMLVFRATYVKRPKPKRKPLQLINFVSRKGCRKSVAVEVNRLNLAEIGQNKTRTKQQPQQQFGNGHNKNFACEGKSMFEENAFSNSVSVGSCVNGLEESDSACVCCGNVGQVTTGSKKGVVLGQQGDLQPLGSEVIINCMPEVAGRFDGDGRGTNAGSQQTTSSAGTCSVMDTPPVASVAPGLGAGVGMGAGKRKEKSKHVVVQKKSKVKLKRTKTDASVMTEISFGTGNIPDMYHNPLSPNDCSTKNNHSSTFISPPQSDHVPYHTQFSQPIAKKGFMHKGTSPKLLFRNGGFNGILNGYALPEVAAALKARSLPQPKTNGKETDQAILDEQGICSLVQKKKKKNKCEHVSKKHTSKKRKKLKRYKNPIGTGKRGTRSFLVSIPRIHCNGQTCVSGAGMGCHDTDSTSPLTEESRGGVGRGKSGTHRRRSEIQLLFDGDKPPGQRLSKTEIPVFTAEDVSVRSSSSCSITGSNSLWLGSSTRKITPVDHFTYPLPSLSPTRRAPSLSSSSSTTGDGNSGTHMSSQTILPHAGSNHRKRVSSPSSSSSSSNHNSTESASLLVFSSDQPPPTKQPKVVSSNSVRMSNGKERVPVMEVEDIYESRLDVKLEVMEEKCRVPNGLVSGAAAAAVTASATAPPHEPLMEDNPLGQSTTVFSGELVVFDSRGECLIRDGEYSILMQSCSSKEGLGLSTFEPLTWDTVFGDGKTTQREAPNLLLKFSVGWVRGPPQHRFCSELSTALDIKKIREVYFLPSPPSTKTSTPSPPTLMPPSLSVKRESPVFSAMDELETFSSVLQDHEKVKTEQDGTREESDDNQQALLPLVNLHLPSQVFFNFLYSNNSLQQTECREALVCPWCDISCVRIYSLLKHMTLCHPHFHFTYTPNSDGKCVINVHVNKMYNTGSSSFDRDPGERSNVSLVQGRRGPSKCLSCSAVLVERHTEVKEDLSEFLNDGSWKRGYNTNRIYYQSHSCLPMLPKEIEDETKEELQTLEWQNTSSQKMIDEFTDVNGGEKELMKLWNIFALKNRVIADKQIPLACIKFAQQNGSLLRERGLVPNFMCHMVNLFEFGLVTPTAFQEGMDAVLSLEAGVS